LIKAFIATKVFVQNVTENGDNQTKYGCFDEKLPKHTVSLQAFKNKKHVQI
jgi:hypothetical protein